MLCVSMPVLSGPIRAEEHVPVTVATRSFDPEDDLSQFRPEPRSPWAMPAMAWDDVDGAEAWSAAVMAALRGPGAPLVQVVPGDIHAWCPAYPEAGPDQRAAFWAGSFPRWPITKARMIRMRGALAGRGTGCCRSCPQPRGPTVAMSAPCRSFLTGRPICDAGCASWVLRFRATG